MFGRGGRYQTDEPYCRSQQNGASIRLSSCFCAVWVCGDVAVCGAWNFDVRLVRSPGDHPSFVGVVCFMRLIGVSKSTGERMGWDEIVLFSRTALRSKFVTTKRPGLTGLVCFWFVLVCLSHPPAFFIIWCGFVSPEKVAKFAARSFVWPGVKEPTAVVSEININWVESRQAVHGVLTV